MVQHWFPRPFSKDELFFSSEFNLKHEFIYSLFFDPNFIELKHKVGVTSDKDGSAKITTRLATIRSFFFKLNIEHFFLTELEAFDVILEQNKRAKKLKIWHPETTWFLLKHEEKYYPVSISKKLKTLREYLWQDLPSLYLEMFKLELSLIKNHSFSLVITL